MNIEITSQQIWDEVKDEVQDKIMDNLLNLEYNDHESIAEVLHSEFEYELDNCRHVVEDICDTQVEYALSELDTDSMEGVKLAVKDLQQQVSKLQSQLKLANFKLRRSK